MTPRRNIGIVAHIDAGKTTLTEQLLVLTGVIRRPGSVEDGSTVSDWREQEQERGITIGSAAVTTSWRGTEITLVDTPGHVDFTVEVERALTVLDGVVVVLSGPDGVQAQTQTVWHQAARHRLPIVGFVNKLDRPGFDDDALQEDIRQRLGIEPMPLQVPVVTGGDTIELLDVLAGDRLRWDAVRSKAGARAPVRAAVTDEEEELLLEIARERVIDLVASYDDGLARAVLEDRAPTPAQWTQAIAAAVQARACLPLVYGVARTGAGPRAVLDAVVDYLPAPERAAAPRVFDAATGAPLMARQGRETAAFVFKTEPRRGGRRVAFVRVFSGTLRSGEPLFGVPGREQYAPLELVRLLGGWGDPTESLEEGAIGGVVLAAEGPAPRTGATLTPGALGVTFESIRVPDPVITIAVEATDAEADARLRKALHEMASDDPSLAVLGEPETGRTLLAGMGELHLELAIERLSRDLGEEIRTGDLRPRGRFVMERATVGRGAFMAHTVPHAQVEIEIEITPVPGADPAAARYRVDPPPHPSWRRALDAALEATLVHELDVAGASVEVTALDFSGAGLVSRGFWEAAQIAVRDAIARVPPVPAEPWMQLSVVVPDEHVGRVSGDLARRRARIQGSSTRGALQVLSVQAPLGEMIRYATDLRSLTGGRGSFTMEPIGYRSLG